MADEKLFLQRFMQNHIGFFVAPAPHLEEVYFARYNLARLDWRALRMEIEKYHFSKNTIDQLTELFKVASDFTFTLMTHGHNYNNSMSLLKERWNEVRALACKIKL